MTPSCPACGAPWSEFRIDGIASGLEWRTHCGYTLTVEIDPYAETEPPPDTEPDAAIAAALLRAEGV